MSYLDLQALVADVKQHLHEHGFHVHGDRHYIETYSLLQTWEIDIHPDEACGGPLDVVMNITANPRSVLALEDLLTTLPPDQPPPDEYWAPVEITFHLPSLDAPPDMLLLATELAPMGGTELPLAVSALDSVPTATDEPERFLLVKAQAELSLKSLITGELEMCEMFEKLHHVAIYLLERAENEWLVDQDRR